MKYTPSAPVERDYAERPPVRDGLWALFGNALATALLFSGIAIFVVICHFA